MSIEEIHQTPHALFDLFFTQVKGMEFNTGRMLLASTILYSAESDSQTASKLTDTRDTESSPSAPSLHTSTRLLICTTVNPFSLPNQPGP
jgi:hypothetical protein